MKGSAAICLMWFAVSVYWASAAIAEGSALLWVAAGVTCLVLGLEWAVFWRLRDEKEEGNGQTNDHV